MVAQIRKEEIKNNRGGKQHDFRQNDRLDYLSMGLWTLCFQDDVLFISETVGKSQCFPSLFPSLCFSGFACLATPWNVDPTVCQTCVCKTDTSGDHSSFSHNFSRNLFNASSRLKANTQHCHAGDCK